eukprot:1761136-Pyramimonas_sp.AAC.1
MILVLPHSRSCPRGPPSRPGRHRSRGRPFLRRAHLPTTGWGGGHGSRRSGPMGLPLRPI